MTESPTIATFSGEEYLQIMEAIRPFVDSGVSDTPPKFIVLMGGVAAGKTTIRKAQYASGYANFEYGEVYVALEKAFGKDHPRLPEYGLFAGSLILGDCLENKKNLVIEIIGGEETQDALFTVIDMMRERGYEIAIMPIITDVAESYQRHLKVVDEDPDYVSAHFSEKLTLNCIQSALAS